MPTTLQTLDSILKTQYLGPIRDQLNNATVLLSRLERNDESVVGKNFTIPLHYGRNEGIGARAEGGNLPAAGNQAYKETIVPMRYIYGRIQITGPTIKASKSNEGAFVRAVDSEMKGLVKDIKSDLNRMLWGDGTGVLTACGATSSSTTINVASTKFLRPGMYVDILTKADGTVKAQNVLISAVGSGTITIAGSAITTTTADAVYRNGSRNLELMGLGGICSDSLAIQTLDPSVYPWWKANKLGNSGTNRAISEILMQTALDTSSIQGDSDPTAMYTSFGVRRAYQNLLTAMKQYVNPLELKGGYKALDYNGKPLIADKDAPNNKIFFIDEDQLALYRLSDFDWMEEDGAILSRVSGVDAYEAVLYLYSELGCSRRNAQTVLEDITEA